jgi:hypothetical protein
MFKWIKTWWQVKKMKKAIWKQVAVEQARQDEEAKRIQEHTQELVKEWLENNEFGLTRKKLETNCMSSVPKNTAKDITKDITAC